MASAGCIGEVVRDWLAFHDSTLLAIGAGDTHVEMRLDAYMHRWERLNDGWKGTGWRQGVRIVLSDGSAVPPVPLLPVEIADGRLQIETVASNDRLPLPLQASGVVKLWLHLATADVVEYTGHGVRIEGTAVARYLEALPGDWGRPISTDTRHALATDVTKHVQRRASHHGA